MKLETKEVDHMERRKIGIVVSEFNYDMTEVMLKKAQEHSEFLGMEVKTVFRVPGTFDSPYGVQKVIGIVDAVAVLGVVLEGETQHDEVVAMHAARKIMDLGLEHGKPVSLGVIGPGVSRLQAEDRLEEYARRAVETLAKLLKRTAELK